MELPALRLSGAFGRNLYERQVVNEQIANGLFKQGGSHPNLSNADLVGHLQSLNSNRPSDFTKPERQLRLFKQYLSKIIQVVSPHRPCMTAGIFGIAVPDVQLIQFTNHYLAIFPGDIFLTTL